MEKKSKAPDLEHWAANPRVESKIIELIQDYAISVNCKISVACFFVAITFLDIFIR